MKLYTVEDEVRQILQNFPDTRSSDNLLYYHYLAKHGFPPVSAINFFLDFKKYAQKYNISSIEIVGRARRKIQELNPELRAVEKVRQAKEQLEIDFMNYAIQK